MADRRDYWRWYYETHREKVAEARKIYYHAHKEEFAERKRRWIKTEKGRESNRISCAKHYQKRKELKAHEKSHTAP